MSSLQEISESLRKQDAGNQANFDALATVLAALLEKGAGGGELQKWADCCEALANTGWHSAELVKQFLKFSTKFTTAFSQAAPQLPERLHWFVSLSQRVANLSENSTQPCSAVLDGLLNYQVDAISSSADRRSTNLASMVAVYSVIDDTAQEISDGYPHASNLIADYYRLAFQLYRGADLPSLRAWCELCSELLCLNRKLLVELFYAVDQLLPDMIKRQSTFDWFLIGKVYPRQPETGLALLNFLHLAGKRIQAFKTELETVLFKFLSLEQVAEAESVTLAQWLHLLGDRLRNDSNRELQCLLVHSASFSQLAQLEWFTLASHRLPIENVALLTTWLKVGFELAASKPEATEAFFKLESAQATDLLEVLSGQVRLSTEMRRLQLFVEAISDSHLQLSPGLDVATDGRMLYLPEVVAVYASHGENLAWLKVALMHQLLSFEAATFNFAYKSDKSDKPFEAFFAEFSEPRLAKRIFSLLEHTRLDCLMIEQYPGILPDLRQAQREACSDVEDRYQSDRLRSIAAFEVLSLDENNFSAMTIDLKLTGGEIAQQLEAFRTLANLPESSVYLTAKYCVKVFEVVKKTQISAGESITDFKSASYRGQFMFHETYLNLAQAEAVDPDVDLQDEQGNLPIGMSSSADPNIENVLQGDVVDGESVDLPDDIEVNLDDAEQKSLTEKSGKKIEPKFHAKPVERVFQYDEWDHDISDYRRDWCSLFEVRDLEQDLQYVSEALKTHRQLANQVKRQLANLRPELLRKVKGVTDGEELDIERAIESIVDKRAGVSPAENIYIERQRKERDVSALFLLDMSASTDDVLPDPNAEPEPEIDYDDYHFDFDAVVHDNKPKRRIIDLEKEAAILMAEALEGLGDSYAICGFSGYGRDKVEYYVCKDFQDPYNHNAKAKIGGIKPSRSTRMGPAIRHATKMLAETESRIKTLIIISDGYPQDYDYGSDRNSRVYGVKDTTKALQEAQQKGVQSFCLTVDQAGHDYLREMCPDQQYMVMRDLDQLPNELSKIYRGLTS